MPDMTLCSSLHCPIKGDCFRAIAKPNPVNEDNGFADFIKKWKEKKGWFLMDNDKEITHEKLQIIWNDMTIYQKIKGYSLESLSDFFMKICNDNRSKFLTKEDWIKLLNMKSYEDCKTGKENIHIDKSN